MSTSNSPLGQELNASAPHLREMLLGIHEQLLNAQLIAVRKLRSLPESAVLIPAKVTPKRTKRKGRSHVDMAFDILKSAGTPLHALEIISRIQTSFGVTIDSESLVSALSKRVARKDRFTRTARNTFTLI